MSCGATQKCFPPSLSVFVWVWLDSLWIPEDACLLTNPHREEDLGGSGFGILHTLGCLSEIFRTLLWTADFGRAIIAWVGWGPDNLCGKVIKICIVESGKDCRGWWKWDMDKARTGTPKEENETWGNSSQEGIRQSCSPSFWIYQRVERRLAGSPYISWLGQGCPVLIIWSIICFPVSCLGVPWIDSIRNIFDTGPWGSQ